MAKKPSEVSAQLFDINYQLHKKMADLDAGIKTEEGISTVPYAPITEAVKLGKDGYNLVLEALPKSSELPALEQLINALVKVTELYPEKEGSTVMPEEVAKDLSSFVINWLANKIHNAGTALAGATGQLQGCAVAELLPDESYAMTKYCSGVLSNMSNATVMKVPQKKETFGNKVMVVNYPQVVDHKLGLHKTKVSTLSQDGKAKIAVEYRESGPQYADSHHRMEGVQIRLEKDGFNCVPKYPTLYCNGELPKEKLAQLGTFFSLLFNGDIHGVSSDKPQVIAEKVWEIAGGLNQKFGDSTFKSGQGELDWSGISHQWKQDNEITKLKPLYDDILQLAKCRDKHHELEDSIGIGASAHKVPENIGIAIIFNTEQAIAIAKKHKWPISQTEHSLAQFQQEIAGHKPVGGTGSSSDIIGNSMHHTLMTALAQAKTFAGCDVSGGNLSDVNAGALTYCEGVLKGTTADTVKGGSSIRHTVAPKQYITWLMDENPEGGYHITMTLPPPANWSSSLAKFLKEHKKFKCTGNQCKIYVKDWNEIRLLALFISNLKGASDHIGDECGPKAMESALANATEQNKKGMFAFNQTPIMETDKAWIKFCKDKFGFLPPSVTPEEKEIMKELGGAKVYAGCTLNVEEAIPNKGVLAYCEGVRKNPQATESAHLQESGGLEQFFHGTTDHIATVSIIPLEVGKYEVTLSGINFFRPDVTKEAIKQLQQMGFTCPQANQCSAKVEESMLRRLAGFMSSLHQLYKSEIPANCVKPAMNYVMSKIAQLPGNKDAHESMVYPWTAQEWIKQICSKVAGGQQPVPGEYEEMKAKIINFLNKSTGHKADYNKVLGLFNMAGMPIPGTPLGKALKELADSHQIKVIEGKFLGLPDATPGPVVAEWKGYGPIPATPFKVGGCTSLTKQKPTQVIHKYCGGVIGELQVGLEVTPLKYKNMLENTSAVITSKENTHKVGAKNIIFSSKWNALYVTLPDELLKVKPLVKKLQEAEYALTQNKDNPNIFFNSYNGGHFAPKIARLLSRVVNIDTLPESCWEAAVAWANNLAMKTPLAPVFPYNLTDWMKEVCNKSQAKIDLKEASTLSFEMYSNQICQWKNEGLSIGAVEGKFYDTFPIKQTGDTNTWIVVTYDSCKKKPAKAYPQLSDAEKESVKKDMIILIEQNMGKINAIKIIRTKYNLELDGLPELYNELAVGKLKTLLLTPAQLEFVVLGLLQAAPGKTMTDSELDKAAHQNYSNNWGPASQTHSILHAINSLVGDKKVVITKSDIGTLSFKIAEIQEGKVKVTLTPEQLKNEVYNLMLSAPGKKIDLDTLAKLIQSYYTNPSGPSGTPGTITAAMDELLQEKKLVYFGGSTYGIPELEEQAEKPIPEGKPTIDDFIKKAEENLKPFNESMKAEDWKVFATFTEYKKLPAKYKDYLHAMMNWHLLKGFKNGKATEKVVTELQQIFLQSLGLKLTPMMIKLQTELEKKKKIAKGELPSCDTEKCVAPAKTYEEMDSYQKGEVYDWMVEQAKEGMPKQTIIDEVLIDQGITMSPGLQAEIDTIFLSPFGMKPKEPEKAGLLSIDELGGEQLALAKDFILHQMQEGISIGTIENQLADEFPGGLKKDKAFTSYVSNIIDEILEEYPGLIEKAVNFEDIKEKPLELDGIAEWIKEHGEGTVGDWADQVSEHFNIKKSEELEKWLVLMWTGAWPGKGVIKPEAVQMVNILQGALEAHFEQEPDAWETPDDLMFWLSSPSMVGTFPSKPTIEHVKLVLAHLAAEGKLIQDETGAEVYKLAPKKPKLGTAKHPLVLEDFILKALKAEPETDFTPAIIHTLLGFEGLDFPETVIEDMFKQLTQEGKVLWQIGAKKYKWNPSPVEEKAKIYETLTSDEQAEIAHEAMELAEDHTEQAILEELKDKYLIPSSPGLLEVVDDAVTAAGPVSPELKSWGELTAFEQKSFAQKVVDNGAEGWQELKALAEASGIIPNEDELPSVLELKTLAQKGIKYGEMTQDSQNKVNDVISAKVEAGGTANEVAEEVAKGFDLAVDEDLMDQINHEIEEYETKETPIKPLVDTVLLVVSSAPFDFNWTLDYIDDELKEYGYDVTESQLEDALSQLVNEGKITTLAEESGIWHSKMQIVDKKLVPMEEAKPELKYTFENLPSDVQSAAQSVIILKAKEGNDYYAILNFMKKGWKLIETKALIDEIVAAQEKYPVAAAAKFVEETKVAPEVSQSVEEQMIDLIKIGWTKEGLTEYFADKVEKKALDKKAKDLLKIYKPEYRPITTFQGVTSTLQNYLKNLAWKMLNEGKGVHDVSWWIAHHYSLDKSSVLPVVKEQSELPLKQVAYMVNLIKGNTAIGQKIGGCMVNDQIDELKPTIIAYCQGAYSNAEGYQASIAKKGTVALHETPSMVIKVTEDAQPGSGSFKTWIQKMPADPKLIFNLPILNLELAKILEDMNFDCAVASGNQIISCTLTGENEGKLSVGNQDRIRSAALLLSSIDEVNKLDAPCIPHALTYALESVKNKNQTNKPWTIPPYPKTKADWNQLVCSKI